MLAGVESRRTELLLNLLASKSQDPSSSSALLLKGTDETAAGSTSSFLSSKLTYSTDENGQKICSVMAGEDEVGVMMGWEQEIMEETVKRLCEGHPKMHGEGMKILNVGFGLGIVSQLSDTWLTHGPGG
jgi:type IV protein arginine methyltransferase